MASAKTVRVPIEPPAELIESMCFRFNHAFGLDKDDDCPLSSGFTEAEREAFRISMRQLYEEATGQGFYKYKK